MTSASPVPSPAGAPGDTQPMLTPQDAVRRLTLPRLCISKSSRYWSGVGGESDGLSAAWGEGRVHHGIANLVEE